MKFKSKTTGEKFLYMSYSYYALIFYNKKA